MFDNICKNCKFWERGLSVNWFGKCKSRKFVDCSKQSYYGECLPIDSDGLGYSDFEGYSACNYVGEYFGCIHWKKEKVIFR